MLIIEDNEEVRSYLESLFSRKYTVHQTVNSKEGVHMAVQLLPGLIIKEASKKPLSALLLF